MFGCVRTSSHSSCQPGERLHLARLSSQGTACGTPDVRSDRSSAGDCLTSRVAFPSRVSVQSRALAMRTTRSRRHEVVYEAVAPRCRDAVVVEAGCGEGYGADLLAGVARRVLALDYDAAAVAHVARRYPRVTPARTNLVALPVRHGVADVVVSLQVIEHLWEQERFLAECRRALRPGGALVVSTPNRLTFSPGRDTPRSTRSHTRELTAELAGLVVGAGVRGRPGGGPAPRAAPARARRRARRLDRGGPDGRRAGRRRVAAAARRRRGGVDAGLALSGDDVDASLDLLVTATAP